MSTQTAEVGGAAGRAGDGHITGYGTKGYRSYVLNMLLLVYILNFIDRGLLSVVAGKLKVAIGASDLGWGFISGFGFAFLYTIVGIPLARVSEQRNRIWIIAICLVVWSGFTALCGLSQNVTLMGSVTLTGLGVLLLFRIGVGIGEAGCTPPANSLISDYFPRERRSTALGWYAMGVTLGTAVANVIGGPIVDAYGWQMTFWVLGLPGIAVAVVVVLTMKEPPRGYSDPPGMARPGRASWSETFSALFSKPSYWWMLAATTIAAFGGYAIANFQSLYLQRTFKVTVGDAALFITGPAYVLGAVGTLLTGWLAQKIGKRSISSIAWLPAVGMMLSVPFYFIGFQVKDDWLGMKAMWWCTAFLALGHFVKYGYLASQYTITAGTVSLRMRATATAILLFAQNMLGYGLGPLTAGAISDFAFNSAFARSEFVSEAQPGTDPSKVLNRHMCDAALQVVAVNNKLPAATRKPLAEAMSGMTPQMDVPRYQYCDKANQEATTFAMLVLSSIYALGGLCFIICMFYLKRDFEAAQEGRFGSGRPGFALGGSFVAAGALGLWAASTYMAPAPGARDVILRFGEGRYYRLDDLIYHGAHVVCAGLLVLGAVLLWNRLRSSQPA